MNTEIHYAGFWLRFLATIIDTIWLYGIVYIALWFLLGPSAFDREAGHTATQLVLEWLIPFMLVMAFWIVKSATPAKMLLNMKIVSADTLQPVSAQKLFLRYIAYFVSMLPLCLGFLWVAWDKKKQGWHDKIAKTVVIRGQRVNKKSMDSDQIKN